MLYEEHLMWTLVFYLRCIVITQPSVWNTHPCLNYPTKIIVVVVVVIIIIIIITIIIIIICYYCVCALAHNALQLPFFFFSFFFSTGFTGRTGNSFSRMFYWLLLLTRVSRYSLETPVNNFVEVPFIVISGAYGQELQQMRGAEHPFESCWAS